LVKAGMRRVHAEKGEISQRREGKNCFKKARKCLKGERNKWGDCGRKRNFKMLSSEGKRA